MSEPSLYERIGGTPTIEALTARFYELMDTLEIAVATRAIHPADLGESREKLNEFLMMWTGGPQTFIEKRGAPMLRARHLPFSIGSEEIEGWLACFHAGPGRDGRRRDAARHLLGQRRQDGPPHAQPRGLKRLPANRSPRLRADVNDPSLASERGASHIGRVQPQFRKRERTP